MCMYLCLPAIRLLLAWFMCFSGRTVKDVSVLEIVLAVLSCLYYAHMVLIRLRREYIPIMYFKVIFKSSTHLRSCVVYSNFDRHLS